MTHREARRALGSRTVRRNGTKTKVLPNSSVNKKAPKSRHFHRRRPRVSVLIARKIRQSE